VPGGKQKDISRFVLHFIERLDDRRLGTTELVGGRGLDHESRESLLELGGELAQALVSHDPCGGRDNEI
jgi:hypothetical protein